MRSKPSETITENLFRQHCGVDSFLEKSATPAECGFRSKKGTDNVGFPDFYLDTPDYAVVVEAKAVDHAAAESEACFYATNNAVRKDILAIAVSGQSIDKLKVSYFFREAGSNQALALPSPKDALLTTQELGRLYSRTKYGNSTTTEALVSVLKNLNKKFHKDGKVRAVDRSLFFSGLMIALNSKNFRDTYKNLAAPSAEEVASTQAVVLEAHNLNAAIIKAISVQLNSKVNNLSKQFSWEDKFSFIKNIDYSLHDYKAIIELVEEQIFKPFKNDEKQDILGRAYKIFLSRAGKAENKNIILTPDHIKAMMVKLADLTQDDVVLDTCTGSGGFLMEAMETMTGLANGNPAKITHIKEQQLIGFEVDSVLFALACSNMFLHGDGKTNLLYRSSLLDSRSGPAVNNTDADLLAYIRRLGPTKAIINPPYENNNSFKFTQQAIEFLEPNGRLVIIMPTPTLTQNEKNGGAQELLKHAQLDFVISMPDGLFSEQGRTVQTSVFGFTKTPHRKGKKVLFYNLVDDGMVSVQHKGKLDCNNKWPGIERQVIDAVNNRTVLAGVSEMRDIFKEDGSVFCAGLTPKMESVHGRALVRIGDLFDVASGSLASGKAVSSGNYDFITAAGEWKKHDAFDYDCEALVYAVAASGSLGRCHYVNGKFTASNLCLVLTPKNNGQLPVNLSFYQNYFSVARPKIVNSLAEGTSKKTINAARLQDYLIEYVPLSEQIGFSSRLNLLDRVLKRVEVRIQREKERQQQMFHCLRCAPDDCD